MIPRPQRMSIPSISRTRPPIAVLGVPIDHVTMVEAIELLERMVLSGRPHYFATANVDFLCQATKDPELHRILAEADLVLCDGAPVKWASGLLGDPLPERVAGADLVPLLLALAALRGYRVFFLGATSVSAADAVRRLKQEHPGLIIAGQYSPPFGPFNDEEIIERIRAARPDILLVALGCPKQEKWIAAHYNALGVPVSGGVGATIDFIARRRTRAPLWMQRVGLEWAFRLACEPRRLFPRYSRDLRVFLYELGLQLLRQMRRQESGRSYKVDVERRQDWCLLKFPRHFAARQVFQASSLEECLDSEQNLGLDLSSTMTIDSTGIGLLLWLRKLKRRQQRECVLLAPSAAVMRSLENMRLSGFFPVATCPSTAASPASDETAGPCQLCERFMT